jgi:transposase
MNDDEREVAVRLYHDYGATVAAKFAATSRQTIYAWVRQSESEQEKTHSEQPRWQAFQIVVGDVIEWCGRAVRVGGIQTTVTRHQGRPGRRFQVFIDDKERWLHWFDQEWVTLAEPAQARLILTGSDWKGRVR